MATQSGGSAFPDAPAVPLADGRADGHTEKICQASGAARIYGMNLCKTEKFSGCAACLSGCGIPAVYRQGCAFLRQFWQTAHTSVPFWERKKSSVQRGHIRRWKHGHYDEYRMKPGSQNLRFSGIIKPLGYREAAAWISNTRRKN